MNSNNYLKLSKEAKKNPLCVYHDDEPLVTCEKCRRIDIICGKYNMERVQSYVRNESRKGNL